MNSNETRIIDLTVEQFKKLLVESVKSINLYNQNEIALAKVNLEGLCKLYGWAKPTVYNWCSQRKIPHFKIGKQLLFDLRIIERWIAESSVKPKTELQNK